jgi:hypothetical protein
MSLPTDNTSRSLPSPKEKRGRGRPKGSKKKPMVVNTKFGAVVENLNSTQRKFLNQYLFSATDSSSAGIIPDSVFMSKEEIRQGRQVPQNDIKKNHLLLKSIVVSKNMTTGDWEVSCIDTNQGKFGTSTQQTEKLDQKLVRSFVTHLREAFEEDLIEYIKDEQ